MTVRAAAKVVREWCQKNRVTGLRKICHVHPRAYVVGKTGSKSIIVAIPSAHDYEPQLKDCYREPMYHVTDGDVFSLQPGDWCIVAYVSTNRSGLRYAVRIPDGR